MPYRDMFNNDIYHNEFDETMTRKFPHSYKIIKTIYPDAYKLPEDEISTMNNILRNQGDTYDEAEDLLRKHIKQNQPQWNLDYLGGQEKSSADWLHNGLEQNLNNLEYPKPKTFQPYPDTVEYPKYKPDEFLPNGDIDFQKVYQRVKKENPKSTLHELKRITNSSPLLTPLNLFIQDLTRYNNYKLKPYHDKYKHAMMNCEAARRGYWDEQAINSASELKEYNDKRTGANTIQESNQDMAANYIGRWLGSLYPDEKCEQSLKPYISKFYPYIKNGV